MDVALKDRQKGLDGWTAEKWKSLDWTSENEMLLRAAGKIEVLGIKSSPTFPR